MINHVLHVCPSTKISQKPRRYPRRMIAGRLPWGGRRRRRHARARQCSERPLTKGDGQKKGTKRQKRGRNLTFRPLSAKNLHTNKRGTERGMRINVLLEIHKMCRWRYTFHPPEGVLFSVLFPFRRGMEKGMNLKCGFDMRP